VRSVQDPADGIRTPEEIMTMRLSVFTMFVNDQDQALRFYVDSLGFVLSEDNRMGDYRWLLVRAPETRDVAINRELARTPDQNGLVEAGRRQTVVCAGHRQLPSRRPGYEGSGSGI